MLLGALVEMRAAGCGVRRLVATPQLKAVEAWKLDSRPCFVESNLLLIEGCSISPSAFFGQVANSGLSPMPADSRSTWMPWDDQDMYEFGLQYSTVSDPSASR